MRRGGWLIAGLVLLCLLVGVPLVVELGIEHAVERTPAPPGAAAAKPRPVRKSAALASDTSDDDVYPPGEPVDFDAVDRSRDLHGIVVKKDGTPVAGARIVAVTYPWRRTDFLTMGDDDTTIDGRTTRTAADGTFAFRLRPGARSALRVTAAGFPPVMVTERLAGERVRVVVETGVRLVVTAVDDENRLVPWIRLRVGRTGGTAGTLVLREATTSESGEAVFEGLPTQSSFTIELLTSGPGNPGWAKVSVGDGPEAAFRFLLPKGRALRGRIVDDATGAPIAKARIGMNWMLDLAVESDADGRYALPGWTGNGIGDIQVLAEGYARAEAEVGAGTEFDFRLRRGFTATGRVVDGSGRAIRGAQVGLVAIVFVGDDPQTSFGNATTDDAGRFRITSLDPKLAHVLVVAAEGFGRLRRAGPAPGDAPVVDLGDVAMPAGHVVSGRVVDAGGKPQPRVAVVLVGPNVPGDALLDENFYGQREDCRTDDLGRFAFADIAAGDYEVSADFEGSEPSTAEVVVPPDHDVSDVTISATGGEVVEVRVVDEQGAGVAKGYVLAQSLEGADVGSETDDHGLARLKLTCERAEIHAYIYGDSRTLIDCKSQKWTRGTASLTFVVREGSAISGVVLDPDGKPVPQAVLRCLYDDVKDDWTYSDDGGEFRYVVPKGRKVRIVFEGLVKGTEPELGGEIECEAPAKDLALRCKRIAPDGKLIVKVTTPDGEALPGAYVHVTGESGSSRSWAWTDAQGIATFTALAPRLKRVSAGHAAWALSVDLTAMPDGRQVVVALRRGVAIRGVLLDADEKPVAVHVQAVRADDGYRVAYTTSKDDGSFVLNVPIEIAGRFRVEAWDLPDGRHRASVDAITPGGEELRVVLSR